MTRQKVIGLKEFEGNLRKVGDAMRGRLLERALLAGALNIENGAKENIQDNDLIDTGTLLRSIHSEVVESGRERVTVAVGTNLEYAAVHEFGATITPKRAQFLHFTVNGEEVFTKSVTIPARPYLRPAFDSQQRAAIEDFKAALRDQIREALG